MGPNNIGNELQSFYEYLIAQETKISKELEPYYEKLQAREKACMNTYGIETPKDRVLFDEIVAIENLKKKIPTCNSYQELITNVQNNINNCRNKNSCDNLKRQISILQNYLEVQKDTENNKDIDVKNKLSQ